MSTDANKAIVREYFHRLTSGDGDIFEMMDDDIIWRVPAGSDFAGEHRGKEALSTLLAGGVGYYDTSVPITIDIENLLAEGDKVACEFSIIARTAAGSDYRNRYFFLFGIRNGRIALVHEHLDTHYANDRFHARTDD